MESPKRKRWISWTVAIVILLLAGAVLVVTWERYAKPKGDPAAVVKAQELHDAAEAAGLQVADVSTLARIYGSSGGPALAAAVSDIAKALFDLSGSTGEVNQRSLLLDEKRSDALRFEWLVIGVYRPELQAEFQKIVDMLKTEGKIPT